MTVDTQRLRRLAKVLCIRTAVNGEMIEIEGAADQIDTLAAEIERLREVLKLAYGAMNYLGDVLNGMDAVEPEDEAATTPAFDAVRAALSGESK